MSPLIFFGSSPFSLIVLQKLISHVVTVVTTPDKPIGRHLKLTPNPVKLLAQKHQISIIEKLEPWTLNLEPSVIGLVAAYGRIIPQTILDKFSNQIYNIHPSLLPKYRGPSPLQQQILDGVTQTGVTIIKIDNQMDHGPIVAVAHDTIHPDDTTQTLGERLFAKGADLFLDLFSNSPLPFPSLSQREGPEVSYTKKITRADGFVPFEKFKNYLEFRISDLEFERKFRAFSPWPGIWSTNPKGKRVKLISLHPLLVQFEGQKPRPW